MVRAIHKAQIASRPQQLLQTNKKKADTSLQNLQLSDSYDSILKIQGVNWLTRKVLNVGSITMTIKQYTDEAGLTHLTICLLSTSELPTICSV